MSLQSNSIPDIYNVSEFLVTAFDGNVNITSTGESAVLSLNSPNISLNSEQAMVQVLSGEEGGSVYLNASGSNASVSMGTPIEGINSVATVTPKGILLAYGPPDIAAMVQLMDSALILSIGPEATGGMITLTPESITFKVGETQMTMTAEGIVTTAPSVEVNCDDTNVVISPEGITEEVGEVTREMTAEGHNLTAAEVEMNVGVQGVTAEGPTSTSEFEGSTELNTAMLTQAMDGMLSVDAPITMVE